MIHELEPLFVKHIPDMIDNGKLYISIPYKVSIHKCACGCDNEVVLSIEDGVGWELTETDGLISLSPSIGNWNFPCQSHYWIRDNTIEWA